MKKVLIVIIMFLISCGDDSSNGNPLNPLEDTSSSVKGNDFSSSGKKLASSSSEKDSKVNTSSDKNDESSSSTKGNSSSTRPDESSSSTKGNSSSTRPDESSSSTKGNSSSTRPDESSSSTKENLSSNEQRSSSSSVSTGICKTDLVDTCIYGTLYDDHDGKIYKTVKIGEQEWMAENLNLDYQENGWAVCHCDSDTSSCLKYGRLCYWSAIVDQGGKYNTGNEKCDAQTLCKPQKPVSGICPTGWHVPSLSDFKKLIDFVGGEDVAGKRLRSRENNGDDSYGFSLLSVYTNDYSDEHFDYDGVTYLATSDENGKDRFYNIYFDKKNKGAYQRSQFKTSFASVRCVKDDF